MREHVSHKPGVKQKRESRGRVLALKGLVAIAAVVAAAYLIANGLSRLTEKAPAPDPAPVVMSDSP